MTLNEFMQQSEETYPNDEVFDLVARASLNMATLNLNTITSLINNEYCTPEEYVEDNVYTVVETIKLLAVWVGKAGYDLEDLAYEVLGQ